MENNKPTKNNNRKIYIILSGFAVVILLLVAFLVWPLLSGIQKNSQDLTSAKDNIASLSIQAVQIKKFKDNYQTYKIGLDKMDQLFVDPNNLVDFIEFLEEAAAGSQVSLKVSLQPASSTSKDSVAFEIVSQGSFSQIPVFVKKIESSPYLLEIENLSIQNHEISKSADSSISTEYASKDYALRQVQADITIKVFTK